MNRPANHAYLNDRQWAELQALASRYEKVWQYIDPKGGSVNLEEHLPPPESSLRAASLHELIKLDLEFRWRHHQPTCLEHYVQTFPELGSMADLPDELIYEEYRVRYRHGDKPALETYRGRFPVQFGRLEVLVREGSLRQASTETVAQPPSPSQLVLAKGVDVGLGYILEKFRGEGQFAQVWEAMAPGRVRCAVKILSSPNDHAQSKTERQALELIKELNNPYILRPVAFWDWGDRLVIATQLATGSLRDRLAECQQYGLHGIPKRELLKYIKNAAEGLDCLHNSGLIHRDIKPANLLYCGEYALVADCGLARYQLDSQRSTQKSFAGTPAYMPGEAWGGKAKPASDLFGLAVTYAELRLGHPLLVEGSSDRWLFALGNPDLSEFSDEEAKVIKQALDPVPQQRQKTCTEFALALERAVLHRPSKRGGFFATLFKWFKRQPRPPMPSPGGRTLHDDGATQLPPGPRPATPSPSKPPASPPRETAPQPQDDDQSLKPGRLAREEAKSPTPSPLPPTPAQGQQRTDAQPVAQPAPRYSEVIPVAGASEVTLVAGVEESKHDDRPQGLSAKQRANAQNAVKAPAMAVMIAGGVGLMANPFMILCMFVAMEERVADFIDVLVIVMLFGCTVAAGLAIWAGYSMFHLRKHALATIGSIAIMAGAFICLFGGVAIGIWSVIVLLKPEVSEAFD